MNLRTHPNAKTHEFGKALTLGGRKNERGGKAIQKRGPHGDTQK